MGAQLFFVAILTFFFVRRLSSDEKVRVSTASGWRTLFYLIFFIITGIMYYMTTQVTIVNNVISVEDIVSDYDAKTNKSNDTINKIEIYNKFSTFGLYKDPFHKDDDSHFKGMGGVTISLTTHLNDSLRFNPYMLNSEYRNLYKSEKNEHPELKQFYLFSLYSSSYKSLFPFKRKFSVQEEEEISGILYSRWISEYPANFKIGEYGFEYKSKSNTYCFAAFSGILYQKSDRKTMPFFYSLKSDVSEVGFFTASDITQYSYRIFIQSRIPVDTLQIRFNLPVEFVVVPDSARISHKSIILTGNQIPNDINGELELYVKSPALANLQLIRSLILTTVLTALFTLFISNLYYWIRKLDRKIRRKHQKMLPYRIAKFIKIDRVRRLERLIKRIFFIIGILLLVVTFRLYDDKPIVLDSDNILLYELILLLVAFILPFICYLLYKFVMKPIYPKEKNDIAALPPTIFSDERINYEDLHQEVNWEELAEQSDNNGEDEEKDTPTDDENDTPTDDENNTEE